MKKILAIHPGPAFSVADVHTGLVGALRQQPDVDVQVANLDDRLAFYCGAHLQNAEGEWIPAFSRDDGIRLAVKGIEQLCYEWWPDVIIVMSGFFIPPDVWAILARRPHHVVLWCTESPYEDDMQAQPARYVDTVIVNDPTNIEWFKTINERTFYMPHSYDPAKHRPGPADPKLECDFAFVGTGFPSRIEFFEKVDWTGINAVFAGNWSEVSDDSPLTPFIKQRKTFCMDNGDAAALYRAAKVTANVYRKETTKDGTADGWAIGPREVELAACETFFMREPRGEGDALFPMLPTFSTPTEFEDQLRYWLAHPAERKSAATQAREAIANRTFDNTAKRLLRLIDGAPTNIR